MVWPARCATAVLPTVLSPPLCSCALLCHVGAALSSPTALLRTPLTALIAAMSLLHRLPGALLSLCATAALLLCCVLPVSVSAAHSFDAYRLVQYDRGTRALGSRRTAFNFPAVVQSQAEADAIVAAEPEGGWDSATDDEDAENVESSSPKSAAADLQRKVVVLPIAQATPAKLRSLLRVRLASALLIVLPADLSSIPAETLTRYAALERFLASRAWEGVAVYFAFEDAYLTEMVADLRASLGEPSSGGKVGDKYHLQVATSDATPVTGATVTNLHVRMTDTRTRADTARVAQRERIALPWLCVPHSSRLFLSVALFSPAGLATRRCFLHGRQRHAPHHRRRLQLRRPGRRAWFGSQREHWCIGRCGSAGGRSHFQSSLQ